MLYDTVIIGHGPAGLSAAIFLARAQLKTIVIGDPAKSQLQYAKNIRNYFGFPDGIDGTALLELGRKQARLCGAQVISGEVVDCTKKKKEFHLTCADRKTFDTKTVLIATGVPIQWAGIKNEKELLGKGVHTCASCDGPLYTRKKVAVVGNGNHAAETALELTSYTKDITVISHTGNFAIHKTFADALKKQKIKQKIARASEFIANGFLKKILFDNGTKEDYAGAFLACGIAGSLDFASKLGVGIKEGLLVVDENGMTDVPGVFAAGNCMGKCKQIAKNVGDGCNAGINIIKYLRSGELYFDYAKH